jgi:hypothetical protein
MPSATRVTTQLQPVQLTAEEQAVYDFVSHDGPNVRRFLEQVMAATTWDTHAAVVTHIVETDAILQATYSKWLAMDLVSGRVHTLERTYESVLRSMIIVSAHMKEACAAPTQAAAAAAMKKAMREVPRLTTRVGWTVRELAALEGLNGRVVVSGAE